MSEQLRIILIIIVSVSIFGLIVFVMVKNYIRNKIQYYLQEMGFTNVCHIEGGFGAMQNSGFKVIK